MQAIAQSESLTDIVRSHVLGSAGLRIDLSVSPQDLVFIEEAFERLLLDYDRVFSAMAIPACLWRRTGEIYKANREFAELVGVDGYMLRDVSGQVPSVPLDAHPRPLSAPGSAVHLRAHGGRLRGQLLGGAPAVCAVS